MKKFLIKVCIYGVVILCISNAIASAGMYILRNSDLYKPSYLVRNINKACPLDYLILGSSTGLTGPNTYIIDSIAKTNGFNLSLDGIGPSGQYMILKLFFEKGFRTKSLILALDSASARNTNIRQMSMNEYYFLPWLGEDYIYDSFRNREDGLVKILSYSRYCPFLGFSYYNQQLLGSCFLSLNNPKKRWHFDNKGNETYTNFIQLSSENEQPVLHDTLYISNPYILKINKLCIEQGVKIIYFLPPQWKRSTIFTASEKDNIINFRNIFNDSPEYFNDGVHVNRNGQHVLSERIGNIFKQRQNSIQ